MDSEMIYMEAAFDEARAALAVGEVPVGCVFVRDGKVIAQGHNMVNETHNATRHAEMICIDQVLMKRVIVQSPDTKKHSQASSLCSFDHINIANVFESVTVYVTVEPCAMCADALGQLGVSEIVFGCTNDRFGGCGSVINVTTLYGYKLKIRGGILEEKAVEMLKEFYKGENPNAPEGKVCRKEK